MQDIEDMIDIPDLPDPVPPGFVKEQAEELERMLEELYKDFDRRPLNLP